jgi:RNA recognition motif-containing protein
VEKMFSECGTVVFVRFAFDEEKQFRGFCHVTFRGTTGDAVDKSMEFDGAEVGGRVLKVRLRVPCGRYHQACGWGYR